MSVLDILVLYASVIYPSVSINSFSFQVQLRLKEHFIQVSSYLLLLLAGERLVPICDLDFVLVSETLPSEVPCTNYCILIQGTAK